MILLAIESSCDETSAAVMQDGRLLSLKISTQKIHEQYGGVVPELASRDHEKHIVPVVHQALLEANITKNQLQAIAVTQGPGLLGSLLVGISFAKALASALHIPLIGIDHMRAHVLAHFIEEPKPQFPFICLTVSGGHTQLLLVKSVFDFEIIGETLDDAVGEAFDKAAKLLGLPYPGGPLIDEHASHGNADRFEFPKVVMPNFNYSFSGIKTSLLYFLKQNLAKDHLFIEQNLNDICASYQSHLIKILAHPLERAAKQYGIKQIAIAGGVAANSGLRNYLKIASEKFGWNTFVPKTLYCTDNAAMIAMAAHFKAEVNQFSDLSLFPNAKMEF